MSSNIASGGGPPLLVLLDDREGLIRKSSGFRSLCNLVGGRVAILDEPLNKLDRDTLASLRCVRFALAIRERTQFSEATLDQLPALELLLQTGGHAYHVDASALKARGIIAALGRRAQRVLSAVPELTMLLALACMRRLGEAVRAMSAQAPGFPPLIGRTLAGKQLGILGMGRHGRAVARLAKAFGMHVVAWDREADQVQAEAVASRALAPQTAPSAVSADDAIPRLSLGDLLASSDVISVHLRLSPASKGLLSHARIQSMKQRSILINTARGAIIDETALAYALVHGPLSAAGLDVFADEPLAHSSPLRTLNNAVLTPHVGWTVEEVFDEFATIAGEQLAEYLSADGLGRHELLDADVTLRSGALGRVAGESKL